MDKKLIWKCKHCDEPVVNYDGYLAVSEHDLRAYEQRMVDFKDSSGLRIYSWDPDDAADPPPTRVEWYSSHFSCEVFAGHRYSIPIIFARTDLQILRLTEHFLRTTHWLGWTNWFEVLQRLPATQYD